MNHVFGVDKTTILHIQYLVHIYVVGLNIGIFGFVHIPILIGIPMYVEGVVNII